MGWVGEGVHALLQTALAFVQVAVRARQVVLSGLPLLLLSSARAESTSGVSARPQNDPAGWDEHLNGRVRSDHSGKNAISSVA